MRLKLPRLRAARVGAISDSEATLEAKSAADDKAAAAEEDEDLAKLKRMRHVAHAVRFCSLFEKFVHAGYLIVMMIVSILCWTGELTDLPFVVYVWVVTAIVIAIFKLWVPDMTRVYIAGRKAVVRKRKPVNMVAWLAFSAIFTWLFFFVRDISIIPFKAEDWQYSVMIAMYKASAFVLWQLVGIFVGIALLVLLVSGFCCGCCCNLCGFGTFMHRALGIDFETRQQTEARKAEQEVAIAEEIEAEEKRVARGKGAAEEATAAEGGDGEASAKPPLKQRVKAKLLALLARLKPLVQKLVAKLKAKLKALKEKKKGTKAAEAEEGEAAIGEADGDAADATDEAKAATAAEKAEKAEAKAKRAAAKKRLKERAKATEGGGVRAKLTRGGAPMEPIIDLVTNNALCASLMPCTFVYAFSMASALVLAGSALVGPYDVLPKNNLEAHPAVAIKPLCASPVWPVLVDQLDAVFNDTVMSASVAHYAWRKLGAPPEDLCETYNNSKRKQTRLEDMYQMIGGESQKSGVGVGLALEALINNATGGVPEPVVVSPWLQAGGWQVGATMAAGGGVVELPPLIFSLQDEYSLGKKEQVVTATALSFTGVCSGDPPGSINESTTCVDTRVWDSSVERMRSCMEVSPLCSPEMNNSGYPLESIMCQRCAVAEAGTLI